MVLAGPSAKSLWPTMLWRCGEFGCKVEACGYAGRKVTAVRLSWWAKNLDERKSTLNELRFSRVGRRARLKGEVVTIATAGLPLTPPQDVAVAARLTEGLSSSHPNMLPSGATIRPLARRFGTPHPNLLPSGGRGREGGQRSAFHPKTLPSAGESGLTERQMERFRRDFRGLDVAWPEREFREWVADREPPDDYAAAFYGFMKRKKAEM